MIVLISTKSERLAPTYQLQHFILQAMKINQTDEWPERESTEDDCGQSKSWPQWSGCRELISENGELDSDTDTKGKFKLYKSNTKINILWNFKFLGFLTQDIDFFISEWYNTEYKQFNNILEKSMDMIVLEEKLATVPTFVRWKRDADVVLDVDKIDKALHKGGKRLWTLRL